jgi:hypothetical protein
VFRGASSSTTLPLLSTTVGTVNTWYIRAYDLSGLYSITSTSVLYSVQQPSPPTGLSASFSVSSTTSSTCNISWNTTLPTNGFQFYKVYAKYPSSSITYTVLNPFINLEANWEGLLEVEVSVVDLLSNESNRSTKLNIEKLKPNQPLNTTITPIGNRLVITWQEPEKTSLPVSGFEIRLNNTNWGSKDSNFIWKGDATDYNVISPNIGLNQYYISTYDTDRKYASTGVSIAYTVLRPSPPLQSSFTYSYSDTSLTAASVEIKWDTPQTTTFAPAKYKLELTKPNGISDTIILDSTRWNTQADWVGTANLKIWTIDQYDLQSSTFSQISIIKQPPNAISSSTTTLVPYGSSLELSWLVPIKSSLPLNGYEVRTSDTGWGSSGYLWKGVSTSTLIPVTTTGTKTYFIRAFDTDSVYSNTSASKSINVTAPAQVSSLSYSFIQTESSSNIELKWAPPASLFAISHYKLRILFSDNSFADYIVTSTDLNVAVTWIGTATVSITAFNILGHESTSNSLVIDKLPPATPGVSIVTPTSAGVLLDWPDNVRTSLPISGYEIRSTDSGFGTAGSIWKGSVSNAILRETTIGVKTYYLRAYDTSPQYSSASRVITYTISAPSNIIIAAPIFSDTAGTAALVTFSWKATKGTFDIYSYEVELTTPNGITSINSLTTSWTTAANWVGSATLRVRAVDTVGIYSSWISYTNIVVSAPSAPASFTTIETYTGIQVSWESTVGTLPIMGYEIRTTNNGFGTPGFVWRGISPKADINSLNVGTNTFYIVAYDTELNYSTVASFSYVLAAPNPVLLNSISYSYADTALTAATITFNWQHPTVTKFETKEYVLTLTKPGLPSVTTRLYSTSWTTAADWIGSASLAITTLDILNNTSTTTTLSNIQKTRPAAPTSYTAISPNFSTITLQWAPAVAGSLPIHGYELRQRNSVPGFPDYIWKGSSTSIIIDKFSSINEWDIWTYDTDSKYSATALAVTFNISPPSQVVIDPATFSSTLTNATIKFTWETPSSSFGIKHYEVSFVTTNPSRTISERLNSTQWELPADWLGNGTLNVVAVNSIDMKSTNASLVVTKLAPGQPGAFATPIITGTSIELDWPDTPKTTLPILGYELRATDTNWGSQGFIWKGSASSTTIDLTGTPTGTTLNYFIKAFDTDNRYSTSARQLTGGYTVLAPQNTASVGYNFQDTSLTSATVHLYWEDTSPIFGLKHYELRGTISSIVNTVANSVLVTVTSTKGISVGDYITNCATIPSDRIVTSITSSTSLTINSPASVTSGNNISCKFNNKLYVNATTIDLPANWLGSKDFTVRTVDTLGNMSTGTSISVTKSVPGIVSNFRAQVIDNTVLLYWQLPEVTSLPISHVEVRKGPDWPSALMIGEKDGTFTTLTEFLAGTYTYWIAVVDTDNNYSVPISLVTQVSQPPDYVFNAEWVSTFNGTKSNCLLEKDSLVLPVNLTETFASHFTTRTWNTPQDQINAGFPVYIQPATTTGYYEEVFDYGNGEALLLGASQVSLSLNGSNIEGSVSINIELSTSIDGITFSAPVNSYNAFLTNFRFVKVKVTVTQLTVGAVYRLDNLTLRLDAKQKTDGGSSVLTYGGAHPQANISPDYLDLWKVGSLPTPTYSLNGLATENLIISSAGPGGSLEPTWACVDLDLASDADGGWNSVYFPANLTKGHLFVVFMKTTTNTGSTYWGTNLNSTLASLAGTASSNPYFLSGIDLPALNTWYMCVGYVYPIGHGSTDDGISGVYNLAGTKIAGGTSFKALAGATSLMHRCYHYYNVTGSGAIVQYMARPVVLQCDSTIDAQSKLAYVRQCAVDYGVSVQPNNSFIDIISITATPQSSTTPTSPVVDFFDTVNPKRFNIFNYNNSGVLQPGTISWTVRGY